jgi:hypothetical protein
MYLDVPAPTAALLKAAGLVEWTFTEEFSDWLLRYCQEQIREAPITRIAACYR